MDKEDGRRLTRQAQYERRKQAARLHKRGMGIEDIAAALSMGHVTVRQWLDEQYPAIADRAQAEDAEIHWGDETAVVHTDVRGRGYQPKGQRPVAYAVGGTRHKLSMISTDTNQGKARWMIVDDAFNSDKLIEFLQALIKDSPKKVFLILDKLRVHHSKPVKGWLAEHKA